VKSVPQKPTGLVQPELIPPKFLAFNHGDVQKAWDHYQSDRKWRRDLNIDTILTEPHEVRSVYSTESFASSTKDTATRSMDVHH
jgi:hypothetical protein